jgi:hypothetical protein
LSCKCAAIFKYSNYESGAALAVAISNDLRKSLKLKKGDMLQFASVIPFSILVEYFRFE